MVIIIKYSLAKIDEDLVIIVYEAYNVFNNFYKTCALVEYKDGHLRAVDENLLERIEFNYEEGDDDEQINQNED
jgi:hypothetical protein